MQGSSDLIYDNLRYLRRYARALLGSQKSGDLYVRLCLETLLADESLNLNDSMLRTQLFKLFHQVWKKVHMDEANSGKKGVLKDLSPEARIQALPDLEKQVLLLNALEGFSIKDISHILEQDVPETQRLLHLAWEDVNAQISTKVVIIEDEPVIALDIAGLVAEIGHEVAGVASSHREAVKIARESKPGLILADIDLGAGGSGLEAVQEILQNATVPVIFVTAYPERLLTGERPEPTYLVTKPFEPETLKVTISQALTSPARSLVVS